jgi:hypothetical protein
MRAAVRHQRRSSIGALVRGLAVVLAAAAVAGCSTPPIAFDQLDQEVQRARCEHLTRCGLFADEGACLDYFWVLSDPGLAAAVAVHRVEYDAAVARLCVESLAGQGCDLTMPDARTDPSACTKMLRGTQAALLPCSFDAECVSGVCELGECSNGCCLGTCRAVLPPGGDGLPCTKATDCKDGLVCGMSRTCHAPAAAGEDCASDRECAAGLGCINPLTTMPGTSRVLPHLGEECPYGRCADEGARCDTASGACQFVGLPGAACNEPGDCSPYAECDTAAHLCRAFPRLGMPCTAGCGGEAYCARNGGPTGVCATPQPNGSPCTAYNECASFYCASGPIFDSCNDAPVCL